MIERQRIALLTGAALSTLSSSVATSPPGWHDDIPLALRAEGVIGVSVNGDRVYRDGSEITGVWFDEAEEIFRGHEAPPFTDDLAARIAGCGDPF